MWHGRVTADHMGMLPTVMNALACKKTHWSAAGTLTCDDGISARQ
ncbi:MAG: hypothetical protein R2856_20910 [Caldilineaceae bacterium]